MNKAQRKMLDNIIISIEELHSQIEALKQEEQDKIDNMGESFGETERYRTMEQVVDYLEDACNEVENAKCSLENARDE
jgi:hypothetical protein